MPAAHIVYLRIQPPGLFHLVYTPVKTIAIGGHFLSEDTMHLTLISRLLVSENEGQATNGYLEETLRSIAHLLLASVERGDDHSELDESVH